MSSAWRLELLSESAVAVLLGFYGNTLLFNKQRLLRVLAKKKEKEKKMRIES